MSSLLRDLLGFVVVASMMASGCTETIVPPESSPRYVQVKAVRRVSGVSLPLNGVRVSAYRYTGPGGTSGAALASGSTDAQGLARLTVPLTAASDNISFVAVHDGAVRVISPVLLCCDTSFTFVFSDSTSQIDCATLDRDETITFTDDNGSARLPQGSPGGIGNYGHCWSIQNPLGNGPVGITIPAFPASATFALTDIFVDGAPVARGPATIILGSGSTLTVCATASTVTAGTFDLEFPLTVDCLNQHGTIRLTFHAQVVPPECACAGNPLAAVDLAVFQSVPVGDSSDVAGMVFRNTMSCTATITSSSIGGANPLDWNVIDPVFGTVTVPPGGELNIRVRFKPKTPGPSTALLTLKVSPTQNSACDLPINLLGNACGGDCPTLEFRDTSVALSGIDLIDTMTNRSDRGVLIESPAFTYVYPVANPATACGISVVTIDATESDPDAARFYRVDPTSLALAPGSTGAFRVTFTPPTAAEFSAIAARRRGSNPPQSSDSDLVLTLRLSSGSCAGRLRILAHMVPCPNVSEPVTLQAYLQRTRKTNIPLYRVYRFGDDNATTVNPLPGSYPPDQGDIYIDVKDITATAVLPQEPILKIRQGSGIRMALWRSNMPIDMFKDPCNTQFTFCGERNKPAYSTADITGIRPEDVYAVDFGGGVYALVYIHSVFNGTEATSDAQSQIQFFVMYPVRCP
jgi:hypothetical protein